MHTLSWACCCLVQRSQGSTNFCRSIEVPRRPDIFSIHHITTYVCFYTTLLWMLIHYIFIPHLTMYLYNNKHILSICTYHGIYINAYCLHFYTTHHINNQYFYTTYPIFAQFPILCTYLDFCSPTSIYRIFNKPY